MIEKFSFNLKNNKAKLLKRVTWIWYFILLVLIALFAFSENITDKQQKRLLIRLGVLVVAGIITYLNKNKKDTFKSFQLAVFFFSLVSIYTFFGIYFFICFILFSVFIFWFTQQKINILFTNENIIIKNGFFKRLIQWEILNNIILKDGILTLDFKNDKLIQEEVEGEVDNETDFNSFLQSKFQ